MLPAVVNAPLCQSIIRGIIERITLSVSIQWLDIPKFLDAQSYYYIVPKKDKKETLSTRAKPRGWTPQTQVDTCESIVEKLPYAGADVLCDPVMSCSADRQRHTHPTISLQPSPQSKLAPRRLPEVATPKHPHPIRASSPISSSAMFVLFAARARHSEIRSYWGTCGPSMQNRAKAGRECEACEACER